MRDEAARGADLTTWLRAETRRRLIWGETDCLLTPADWVSALGLPDPAAPWRGTYHDEAAAEAVLAANGGVILLMRTALAAIGAPMLTHAVRQARRGDVGAVRLNPPSGPVITGAICTGRRWAGRAPGGLWIGHAEPLAAWRIDVPAANEKPGVD